MKNIKTTLAGIVAGFPVAIDALITAYNAGTFSEKSGTQLIFAIGIVLIGLWAKDHNVSGTNKIQSIVKEDGAVLPDKPLK